MTEHPPFEHSTHAQFARTQLVMEVLKRLDGAYGLLFKSRHYPGELVACKRGSPLILGLVEQHAEDGEEQDSPAQEVSHGGAPSISNLTSSGPGGAACVG